jgi:serine/threonine-protein kinase
MIGTTVSHYRIVEKIGEGGMGVVYKAEDTALGRHVALKFLPPHILASDVESQRFLNEARTAAKLSHPAICTVYEIDTAGGHTFIAMEYIPGEDLARRLAAGPLEFNQAAATALDLCGALREAHAAGIIHRDIKPSNIMVSAKGRTVLLDFGVAKLKGDSRLTRTGTTVGTSGYMSPEQVRGEVVDHRTDIWSLGVVLYEMLTGQLPFRADHEAAVLYSIVNDDPEAVSRVRPNVPAKLGEIVEKALAKRPSNRYQNIDALQADLEVFLGKQEGRTTPTSVQLGIEEVRRRRVIRGLWVASFVIVAAAAGWLSLRDETPPGEPAPAAKTTPAPSASVARKTSIAVLPLADLSSAGGNEFFADGMTEELITQLAQIKSLKVISRTSIMQYKNTTKRLPEIAAELGVADILEGSVFRAGDQVRISVQLIDAANDQHLWANSYESDLADVLAIQRRVAADVVGQIETTLTPEETERLRASPVVNTKAYELYLQGRYHWNKRTPEGIQRAIDLYEQALAADPKYALAYAGIAESYVVAITWSYMSPHEGCAKAKEAADNALAIDPELPAAYAVRGVVGVACDWDWDGALRHLTRALELNPGDATTRQWYSQILGATGRLSEAAAQARISAELDPLAIVVNGAAAVTLASAGEFDSAKGLISKLRSLDPDAPAGCFYEAAVEYTLNDPVSAARATVRYIELIAATDRDRADARAIRSALDEGGTAALNGAFVERFERNYREGQPTASWVAAYFAQMGEADSAMTWLERAYRGREGIMWQVAQNGMFLPLRSDPRYVDLLARMGLRARSAAPD